MQEGSQPDGRRRLAGQTVPLWTAAWNWAQRAGPVVQGRHTSGKHARDVALNVHAAQRAQRSPARLRAGHAGSLVATGLRIAWRGASKQMQHSSRSGVAWGAPGSANTCAAGRLLGAAGGGGGSWVNACRCTAATGRCSGTGSGSGGGSAAGRGGPRGAAGGGGPGAAGAGAAATFCPCCDAADGSSWRSKRCTSSSADVDGASAIMAAGIAAHSPLASAASAAHVAAAWAVLLAALPTAASDAAARPVAG